MIMGAITAEAVRPSPSAVSLWLARRSPAVASLGVRLWSHAQFRAIGREHWLFLRLKSELRLRLPRPVLLASGQLIFVDPFEHVGRAIARDGCYEPDTVALVRALLPPGSVFVDVGAHVGQYTLMGAQMAGSDGHVHAFEPDPANCALLRASVRANRCANVTCTEAALAASGGTASLHLSDVASTCGNSLGETGLTGGRAVTVALETLDAYVRSHGITRIDLVKADVEGAELPMLSGGSETLARFQPPLILEFSTHTAAFGYSRADLAAFLLERGYDLYEVGPLPLAPLTRTFAEREQYNVLALPAALRAAMIGRGIIAA
jgi:FkbM family methyltransferase